MGVGKSIIRYRKDRFRYNSRILFVLATVLFVEQLVYGLVFTDVHTLIGRTHIITALVCLGFSIGLGFILYRNRDEVTGGYLQEMVMFSLVAFGLLISIYRSVYISSTDFSIPVIYIAVLYGSAFLFYFPPIWSFLLYGCTAALFISLNNCVNHEILYATFVQDIIINNLLAFIGASLAYNRFMHQIDDAILIEEKNEELDRISGLDWLTKLINRRKIDEYLEQMHESAVGESGTYCVIIADIDHFKKINDQFGHTVGDKVLVESADLLRSSLKDEYIVGRWGGEEFIILLPDVNIEKGKRLAEMVRAQMESHNFSIDKKITCSFGISEYRKGYGSSSVVRRADKALYMSKENGRNQVSVN